LSGRWWWSCVKRLWHKFQFSQKRSLTAASLGVLRRRPFRVLSTTLRSAERVCISAAKVGERSDLGGEEERGNCYPPSSLIDRRVFQVIRLYASHWYFTAGKTASPASTITCTSRSWSSASPKSSPSPHTTRVLPPVMGKEHRTFCNFFVLPRVETVPCLAQVGSVAGQGLPSPSRWLVRRRDDFDYCVVSPRRIEGNGELLDPGCMHLPCSWNGRASVIGFKPKPLRKSKGGSTTKEDARNLKAPQTPTCALTLRMHGSWSSWWQSDDGAHAG